jgi:hypothetical protein
MEKELFFAAHNENDAFNAYLEHFPALAETVVQQVAIVERVGDSMKLPDLLAGRSAMALLHTIACEGGFQALSSLFYLSYEWYCRSLLNHV